MSPYPLPIETWTVKRMDQLSLRPAEVAERCGIIARVIAISQTVRTAIAQSRVEQ